MIAKNVKMEKPEMPYCPQCDAPVCDQPRGSANGRRNYHCPMCGEWFTESRYTPTAPAKSEDYELAL